MQPLLKANRTAQLDQLMHSAAFHFSDMNIDGTRFDDRFIRTNEVAVADKILIAQSS